MVIDIKVNVIPFIQKKRDSNHPPVLNASILLNLGARSTEMTLQFAEAFKLEIEATTGSVLHLCDEIATMS